MISKFYSHSLCIILHMGVVYIWLHISKVEIKLWFLPGPRSLKLCYWFLSYSQAHHKPIVVKYSHWNVYWWEMSGENLGLLNYLYNSVNILIIIWSEAKWNFTYLSEDFRDYEFLIYRWHWHWLSFFASAILYGPLNLCFKEAPLLL